MTSGLGVFKMRRIFDGWAGEVEAVRRTLARSCFCSRRALCEAAWTSISEWCRFPNSELARRLLLKLLLTNGTVGRPRVFFDVEGWNWHRLASLGTWIEPSNNWGYLRLSLSLTLPANLQHFSSRFTKRSNSAISRLLELSLMSDVTLSDLNSLLPFDRPYKATWWD